MPNYKRNKRRRPAAPRNCPNCGRLVEGGRQDKKFCDDHCRLYYHRGGKINRPKVIATVERIARAIVERAAGDYLKAQGLTPEVIERLKIL